MDIELLRKIEILEKKVNHLEFKFQLSQENTNISRLLIDYNITKAEYEKIMDLMDEFSLKITKKEKIIHHDFEKRIYQIQNNKNENKNENDYHFCEALAKAFMEDERWEDVFPKLYGDLPKYKNYMKKVRTKND